MWRALLALATAAAVRSPLRLRLPRAQRSRDARAAQRVSDVDTCFPFRGAFENGCELVTAMCETRKYVPDPLRPSWCGMWTHQSFDLWQHCEDEVRLGDEAQAFVDSTQWTAIWDTGSSWATYNTSCHAVEADACAPLEALTLARAPVPTTPPVGPPGGLFPDAPETDFFVATGATSGPRNFVVENGHLVQTVNGTLNHTANATLNGRGEILWSDAPVVSRHEGVELAGYGMNFVACFAKQEPPPCVSMCEGHSPNGPCHYLCMALSACRTTCSYGTNSRSSLQGCVNTCLHRDTPLETVPESLPCPLVGCPTQPVGAPGGLTPQQAEAIEWRLSNMTERTEMEKQILANATAQRDLMRGEFRDLLMHKITEASGTPALPVAPAALSNATNATNGTASLAPAAAPAPAPALDGQPATPATPAPERYQTPAADAAAAALEDEIASTQAQTQAVAAETMAYENQIHELHAMP